VGDGIRQFASGAQRSGRVAGQGRRYPRYDLISHVGLRRLAETYAEGAERYQVHNWRRGCRGGCSR